MGSPSSIWDQRAKPPPLDQEELGPKYARSYRHDVIAGGLFGGGAVRKGVITPNFTKREPQRSRPIAGGGMPQNGAMNRSYPRKPLLLAPPPIKLRRPPRAATVLSGDVNPWPSAMLMAPRTGTPWLKDNRDEGVRGARPT